MEPGKKTTRAQVDALCENLEIEYTINLDNSIDLYVDRFPGKALIAGYEKGTTWNTIYQDLLIIDNYTRANNP